MDNVFRGKVMGSGTVALWDIDNVCMYVSLRTCTIVVCVKQ